MAETLDSTPDDEVQEEGSRLHESIKRIPEATRRAKKLATFDDYLELIRDRPAKFTAEQVGYSEAKINKPNCLGCAHYFRSKDRSVCEIFRPEPEEDIKIDWKCAFQTADGESYPYQPKDSRTI